MNIELTPTILRMLDRGCALDKTDPDSVTAYQVFDQEYHNGMPVPWRPTDAVKWRTCSGGAYSPSRYDGTGDLPSYVHKLSPSRLATWVRRFEEQADARAKVAQVWPGTRPKWLRELMLRAKARGELEYSYSTPPNDWTPSCQYDKEFCDRPYRLRADATLFPSTQVTIKTIEKETAMPPKTKKSKKTVNTAPKLLDQTMIVCMTTTEVQKVRELLEDAGFKWSSANSMYPHTNIVPKAILIGNDGDPTRLCCLNLGRCDYLPANDFREHIVRVISANELTEEIVQEIPGAKPVERAFDVSFGWLQNRNACSAGLIWFAQRYGTSTVSSTDLRKACVGAGHTDWAVWLDAAMKR